MMLEKAFKKSAITLFLIFRHGLAMEGECAVATSAPTASPLSPASTVRVARPWTRLRAPINSACRTSTVLSVPSSIKPCVPRAQLPTSSMPQRLVPFQVSHINSTLIIILLL